VVVVVVVVIVVVVVVRIPPLMFTCARGKRIVLTQRNSSGMRIVQLPSNLALLLSEVVIV